jgi:small-conductance mechanosensitive channel
MLQAASDVPRVLAKPEPKVLLMAFGASAIEFEIRFWISDPEEGISNIRSEVLKRVWQIFREHDVELPFQQHDIHIKDWPSGPSTPERGG